MRNYQIISLFALVLAFSSTYLTVSAGCVYDKSLNGEAIAIGTMLTWSTINETDNSLFIIEKSPDGAKFEAIGNLVGAGNSQVPKKYSFLDIKAGSGKLYYRLKQVDYDGAFQYTEVLDINKTEENKFMVSEMSSETTSRTFEMQIDALTDAPLTCQLRDAKGAVIKEQAVSLVYGINTVSIDLSDQNAGLYKVALISGDEEEILVIRRVLDETERASNVATNKKADTKKN